MTASSIPIFTEKLLEKHTGDPVQLFMSVLIVGLLTLRRTNGAKYSRMDQVKYVEDSLLNI